MCHVGIVRFVTSNLDTIIFGGSTFYRHLWHGDHEIPYNTCTPPGQHISISLWPSQVVQEICESTGVNCHRSTIFSQAPPLQTLSNRAAQGNGFGQISTRTELRYQGQSTQSTFIRFLIWMNYWKKQQESCYIDIYQPYVPKLKKKHMFIRFFIRMNHQESKNHDPTVSEFRA